MKLKIARAQLGCSLSLFIDDKDPFSVHALACGGSEIIEGLAATSGIPTLSTHILATFPEVEIKKIRYLRNQYWNSIKHFYSRDNSTARDDERILADFSDSMNDAVLFMGWIDYLMVTKRLPVEAQVFQVWWYATNESRMNSNVDATPYRTEFPGIAGQSRREQKAMLKQAVQKYLFDAELLADTRTEAGPLIIDNY